MARSVGTLFVNLVTKTQKFEKGLRRASKRLEAFSASVKRYGMIGIGALAGLATYAVKVASDFETITVRLETMLGSLGAAKKMMKEINQFSTATPFTPGELAQSASKLLAFGVAQDTVLVRMRLLGDIASGSGTRLSELVGIFGKMKSSGVVALGDLNQLGDRGIPILETLKVQLNLMEKGALRKFVSTGKLGFQDVLTALQSMTAEGGVFNNAMSKLSKTTKGLFSTLMGNVELLADSFGKRLLPAVNKVMEQINNLAKAGKEFQSSISFNPIIRGALQFADIMQEVSLSFEAALSRFLVQFTKIASWADQIAKSMPAAMVPAPLKALAGAFDVDASALDRMQARARNAEAAYDNRVLPSTRYQNAQIAKPTEYARTRGMRPGQEIGGRPMTPAVKGPGSMSLAGASGIFGRVMVHLNATMRGLSNAAAIGRKEDVLGQRYAGLAERGTAAGYRAQQKSNTPMQKLNETSKKQLTELKLHSTVFKDLGVWIAKQNAKLVSLPT